VSSFLNCKVGRTTPFKYLRLSTGDHLKRSVILTQSLIYLFISGRGGKICLPKENEVKVHNLKAFNITLLKKWCWRMNDENEVYGSKFYQVNIG
jgi:hypothetical protein